MHIVHASPALVAAVSFIITGQMAALLRANGITDRATAVAALRRYGFGTASVMALVDRALIEARAVLQ